jgi:hypothetical protein
VLVRPPREVQEPATIDRWSSPPPDSRRGVSLFSPRRERGTIPDVSASEADLFVRGVSHRRNIRRLTESTTNKPLRGQHEVLKGYMTAHVIGACLTESGPVFSTTKEGAIGDVSARV